MTARELHRFARSWHAATALVATGSFIACSAGTPGESAIMGGTEAIQGEAGVYTCPGLANPVIDCPSGTLTYDHDVAPILAAHCIGCHGPGGESADYPLDTYAGIRSETSAGGLAINCRMPPPPLPPLTLDETTTLDCWLRTCSTKPGCR